MEQSIAKAIEAYFDAVWVLSLRGSKARHVHLKKALFPLNYTLCWGIEGKDYTEAALIQQGIYDPEAARMHTNERRGLAVPEIACAWSHRRLYEAMIAQGLRQVLVLEDDVAPCETAIQALPQVLRALPRDWEFCYFGYYGNERYDLGQRIKQSLYRITQPLGITRRVGRKIGRKRYPRSYAKHLSYAGFHYGSHAYALRASAAKKLIQHQQPIAFVTDILFAHLIYKAQLKAFIAVPNLFDNRSVQGDFASSVLPYALAAAKKPKRKPQ